MIRYPSYPRNCGPLVHGHLFASVSTYPQEPRVTGIPIISLTARPAILLGGDRYRGLSSALFRAREGAARSGSEWSWPANLPPRSPGETVSDATFELDEAERVATPDNATGGQWLLDAGVISSLQFYFEQGGGRSARSSRRDLCPLDPAHCILEDTGILMGRARRAGELLV